ncbi:MAG: DinB family protein [Acidobacteriota bacterium]
MSELEAADQRAEQLARGLTYEQLNWTPAPGAWSVGQCLQHLLIANQVYLQPISKALDGRPPSPVNEVRLGWFSSWFIRTYIAPSSSGARSPAPKKIRPAQDDVDLSVLDAFLASNLAARELIFRAGHYDVNRIRFKNPLVPLVRFTVGTGLEIVSNHERRHLLQAERVRESPAFPRL